MDICWIKYLGINVITSIKNKIKYKHTLLMLLVFTVNHELSAQGLIRCPVQISPSFLKHQEKFLTSTQFGLIPLIYWLSTCIQGFFQVKSDTVDILCAQTSFAQEKSALSQRNNDYLFQ